MKGDEKNTKKSKKGIINSINLENELKNENDGLISVIDKDLGSGASKRIRLSLVKSGGLSEGQFLAAAFARVLICGSDKCACVKIECKAEPKKIYWSSNDFNKGKFDSADHSIRAHKLNEKKEEKEKRRNAEILRSEVNGRTRAWKKKTEIFSREKYEKELEEKLAIFQDLAKKSFSIQSITEEKNQLTQQLKIQAGENGKKKNGKKGTNFNSNDLNENKENSCPKERLANVEILIEQHKREYDQSIEEARKKFLAQAISNDNWCVRRENLDGWKKHIVKNGIGSQLKSIVEAYYSFDKEFDGKKNDWWKLERKVEEILEIKMKKALEEYSLFRQCYQKVRKHLGEKELANLKEDFAKKNSPEERVKFWREYDNFIRNLQDCFLHVDSVNLLFDNIKKGAKWWLEMQEVLREDYCLITICPIHNGGHAEIIMVARYFHCPELSLSADGYQDISEYVGSFTKQDFKFTITKKPCWSCARTLSIAEKVYCRVDEMARDGIVEEYGTSGLFFATWEVYPLTKEKDKYAEDFEKEVRSAVKEISEEVKNGLCSRLLFFLPNSEEVEGGLEEQLGANYDFDVNYVIEQLGTLDVTSLQ